MLHGKPGFIISLLSPYIEHIQLLYVLIGDNLVGTNINDFKDIISGFLMMHSCLGNNAARNECFAETHFIRHQNPVLPMTKQLIYSFNCRKLKVLQMGHSILFNTLKSVSYFHPGFLFCQNCIAEDLVHLPELLGNNSILLDNLHY